MSSELNKFAELQEKQRIEALRAVQQQQEDARLEKKANAVSVSDNVAKMKARLKAQRAKLLAKKAASKKRKQAGSKSSMPKAALKNLFQLDEDEDDGMVVRPGQKHRAGKAPERMRKKAPVVVPAGTFVSAGHVNGAPAASTIPAAAAAAVTPTAPSDPEVLQAITNLAGFVAKQGRQFEKMVMMKQAGVAKFRFLSDTTSPEHRYYLSLLPEHMRGGGDTTGTTQPQTQPLQPTAPATAAATVTPPMYGVPPPRPPPQPPQSNNIINNNNNNNKWDAPPPSQPASRKRRRSRWDATPSVPSVPPPAVPSGPIPPPTPPAGAPPSSSSSSSSASSLEARRRRSRFSDSAPESLPAPPRGEKGEEDEDEREMRMPRKDDGVTGGSSMARMDAYLKSLQKSDDDKAEGSQRAPGSLKRKHHIGDYIPDKVMADFMKKSRGETVGPDNRNKIGQDNKGFAMLQRMGWQEGKGLGRKQQGRAAPVQATTHMKGAGIGAGKAAEVSSNDDAFMQYKKRMSLSYKFRPNPLNNPRKAYWEDPSMNSGATNTHT